MASAASAAPNFESGNRRRREETAQIEIDTIFGRKLGLADGQKASLSNVALVLRTKLTR